MLPFKFDIKLFLLLSLAFFISVIVGTVSHEVGHYAVAKSLGYSSSIHYGFCEWDDESTRPFLDSVFTTYAKQVETNMDFPQKEKFKIIQKRHMKDSFWITMGGPLQTIITGILGLLLLLNQKKKINQNNNINLFQWFCIFLSLFWLRQFVNLFTWVLGFFFNGKFSTEGDEIGLAISLGLTKGTLALSTALISFAIALFILFKIIPSNKRISFIAAGLFGGTVGYLFWLVWFGEMIMP